MQKINRSDAIFGFGSFLSFLVAFAVMKLSNFTSFSIINLQSYIVKSMIAQTSGLGTIESLASVIAPFEMVLASLVFYTLGLSVLGAYGYYFEEDAIGKFVGLFSAIAAIVLFPSLWGAFLAASVLISCLFCGKLASTYRQELKRWVAFRVGSNSIGKMFALLSFAMAIGLFLVIMSNQPFYSSAFRQDIFEMTKSVASSVPGANLLPQEFLNSQVEQLVDSSPVFSAYIRWMPVTTALIVWFVLQFIGMFASVLAGIFTFAIIRVLGEKL